MGRRHDELSRGAAGLLKCAVAEANWDGRLENGRLADAQIDDKLIEEYSVDLTAIGARERYLELARAFEVADSEDPVVNAHRNALIGELRTRLATRCVERLDADLVILDEFQRFRSLMRGDNEAGLLAKALFDFGQQDADAQRDAVQDVHVPDRRGRPSPSRLLRHHSFSSRRRAPHLSMSRWTDFVTLFSMFTIRVPPNW